MARLPLARTPQYDGLEYLLWAQQLANGDFAAVGVASARALGLSAGETDEQPVDVALATEVFDDAATGQGLLNFFVRIICRAKRILELLIAQPA